MPSLTDRQDDETSYGGGRALLSGSPARHRVYLCSLAILRGHRFPTHLAYLYLVRAPVRRRFRHEFCCTTGLCSVPKRSFFFLCKTHTFEILLDLCPSPGHLGCRFFRYFFLVSLGISVVLRHLHDLASLCCPRGMGRRTCTVAGGPPASSVLRWPFFRPLRPSVPAQ